MDSVFSNLPPQPTFPANPSDPRYSMLARIGAALGIEGKRIGQGLWNAATLPGDVATGKTTMADSQAQNRVMDLASAATFGPRASAPEGALTTGWAPGAWRRIADMKKQFTDPYLQSQIDQIAGMTPAEAARTDFPSPWTNIYKDNVLVAHRDDLHWTQQAQQGHPWADSMLRDLRGQPDPDAAPPAAPPPPFVWGREASTIPTFRLKQPDMPPFPANDPRPMPPSAPPRPWPPGMTFGPGELGA